MAAFDTHSTVEAPRRGPRSIPPFGYLWAFGLAVLHTAVTAGVTLGGVTYGGFLPDLLLDPFLGQWLGELVGALLLVGVLSIARWWGATGLLRLRPRDGGWTVIPLLMLLVAGAMVGRAQFDQLLQIGSVDSYRPLELTMLALLIILFAVASVLLALALVPRLLGADGSRSPLEVVLLTGVVIGLMTIVEDAIFAALAPDSMNVIVFADPVDTALRVLAQGLLVLPFVAVALRTGAPWLLLPVLLVRLLTVGPVDTWFWAYAALGAAYAVWLVRPTGDLTEPQRDRGADSEVPPPA